MPFPSHRRFAPRLVAGMVAGVGVLAAGLPPPAALAGAAQSLASRAAPWIELRAPGAFGGDQALETDVTYRVDATVLLPLLFTAVPIASRDNVGIGSFSVRDLREGSAARVRALEFFAASYPDRARGLNRLGFLREATGMTRNEPVWTAHFGVISANREESREAAEEALDREAGLQPYSIIDGFIDAGGAASAVTRLALNGRWTAAGQLYDEIRPLWTGRPPDYERHIPNRERRLYSDPLGFLGGLQASLHAIASDRARGENPQERHRYQPYVHNGHVFRFEIRGVKADARRGAAYAAAGWVVDPGALRRIEYRILDDRGDEIETFQVWVELPAVHRDEALADPIVPVAFEFRPRAFLELRAERTADRPAASPIE